MQNLKNLQSSNYTYDLKKSQQDWFPIRIEFFLVYWLNPLRDGLSEQTRRRKRLSQFFISQKRLLFNMLNNEGGRFRVKSVYFYFFRRGQRFFKKKKRLKTVRIESVLLRYGQGFFIKLIQSLISFQIISKALLRKFGIFRPGVVEVYNRGNTVEIGLFNYHYFSSFMQNNDSLGRLNNKNFYVRLVCRSSKNARFMKDFLQKIIASAPS